MSCTHEPYILLGVCSARLEILIIKTHSPLVGVTMRFPLGCNKQIFKDLKVMRKLGLGFEKNIVNVHLLNTMHSFLIKKWFIKRYYFNNESYLHCLEYGAINDIFFMGLTFKD